jgi:hypothetical protein
MARKINTRQARAAIVDERRSFEVVNARHADFRSLLRAIAARDTERARQLLERSPELVTATEPTGASRTDAASHFLAGVGQYVYAGHTALHVAAGAYDTNMSRVLVDRGADPRAANRRGATPLHCAADGAPGSTRWNPNAQTAVIEYLIGAGADPNTPDAGGVAPLHRAVRSRCSAAVRILLTLGADPRRRNGSGSTPLHLAVQTTGRGGSGSPASHEEQAEIIRLLIEHGARLGDKNARGKTVAQSIRSSRIQDLVQSQ